MSRCSVPQTRVVVLFAVIAIAAMGMGVGPVSAQDGGNQSATANQTPEYVAIDDQTRILEFDIGDGDASMVIESEEPQPMIVSDALAGIEQEGATTVPEKEYQLSEGRNEISLSVASINGDSAVSVSTRGGTIRLSSGVSGGSDDPFRAFGGASGLFTGVVMTVALAGLAAFYVVKTESKGVEKA
ncbi:hypothetical protein [Natrinema ejinorense]|uniref:Uncharacterized protein n=1 Tax=Natrinema ejinorense TaxID=373386 RepID=A0A2A5QTY9_9EURY|nr:hypothetical protein [Natrinema ejinorense]PCR90316.1 hypothetical protein CP557_07055 [Natrinema ejinorense]